MAQAVVEERQLLKTLRWYDGFVIALANPGFLLGSLGYSVLDLGGWGAALLWGITAAHHRAGDGPLLGAGGDVPRTSREASRSTRTRDGASTRPSSARSPRSATGSAGRSSSRSSGCSPARSPKLRGSRTSRTGRTHSAAALIDNGYFSTGSVHIGLQHLIAIGIIIAVWAFNVFGTRIGVAFNYLAGALLMIPLFCFMILPFLTGDFNSSNLAIQDRRHRASHGAGCRSRSSGSGS